MIVLKRNGKILHMGEAVCSRRKNSSEKFYEEPVMTRGNGRRGVNLRPRDKGLATLPCGTAGRS